MALTIKKTPDIPTPREDAVDQTVELFCGEKKSFSGIASALGYATFTVDSDPVVRPDMVADIRNLDPAGLPQKPFIVWAAPPISPVFLDRDYWESDGSFYPTTSDAEQAIALVRSAIGMTTALDPTWWFLEHPRSLLRGMPLFAGFNRGYPSRNRRTIRHDQYGGRGDAETDIWTNAYWWIPRPGESDGEDGVDTGRRVPSTVFSEIFDQLDVYRKTGFYGPR